LIGCTPLVASGNLNFVESQRALNGGAICLGGRFARFASLQRCCGPRVATHPRPQAGTQTWMYLMNDAWEIPATCPNPFTSNARVRAQNPNTHTRTTAATPAPFAAAIVVPLLQPWTCVGRQMPLTKWAWVTRTRTLQTSRRTSGSLPVLPIFLVSMSPHTTRPARETWDAPNEVAHPAKVPACCVTAPVAWVLCMTTPVCIPPPHSWNGSASR
jgi:hypothetical protein